MAELYFAYGSNLVESRLRERVPSARAAGIARLAGRRLALNKLGRDGSAKANVVASPDGAVWGALYTLACEHWPLLDRFEGGYERVAVEVATPDGARRAAVTYEGRRLTFDALPEAWYVRLMIEGARAHGLPQEWVALLEKLPFRAES